MRKVLLLLPAIFLTNFLIIAQTGSELDNDAGTSMKPIVSELNGVIEAFETDSLEIVHIEFDLLFTEQVREVQRYLYSGYTYGFYAYGDYRINEIAMDLYKWDGTNWNWIKAGDMDSETLTTLATLNTDEDQYYKVVLKPNSMVEGYTAGHYALYIIHN